MSLNYSTHLAESLPATALRTLPQLLGTRTSTRRESLFRKQTSRNHGTTVIWYHGFVPRDHLDGIDGISSRRTSKIRPLQLAKNSRTYLSLRAFSEFTFQESETFSRTLKSNSGLSGYLSDNIFEFTDLLGVRLTRAWETKCGQSRHVTGSATATTFYCYHRFTLEHHPGVMIRGQNPADVGTPCTMIPRHEYHTIFFVAIVANVCSSVSIESIRPSWSTYPQSIPLMLEFRIIRQLQSQYGVPFSRLVPTEYK